jgi:hypothetical protein
MSIGLSGPSPLPIFGMSPVEACGPGTGVMLCGGRAGKEDGGADGVFGCDDDGGFGGREDGVADGILFNVGSIISADAAAPLSPLISDSGTLFRGESSCDDSGRFTPLVLAR